MASALPERYQEITDQDADFAYTHDFGGAIVSARGSVEAITGYSLRELKGMRLGDLLEPEFCAQALQDVMEQMGGGPPVARRMMVRSKSGKPVPLEVFSRLLFENGRPVAVEGLGRKPKAYSKGKAKRRAASDDSVRFTTNLRHVHHLNVRSYGSLPEVFQEFLRTGCEIFQLPSGLIHRVSRGQSEILASFGLPPGFLVDIPALMAGANIGSYIGAPIAADGHIYGRLSFFSLSGSPRRYTSEEREMAEMMGSGLGRVILDHEARAESERAARLERDRSSLLEMVSASRPLHDVLLHLVKMIERQSPGSHGAVVLFQTLDGAPSAAQLIASGVSQSYRRSVLEMNFASPEIRSSRLLSSVRSEANLADALPGCNLSQLPEEFRNAAAISAPILSASNEPLGLILLHYSSGAEPRAEDRGMLTMASRTAAIAIEQQQLTDRIAFQTQHDAMTGLPNRVHLVQLLERAVEIERRRDGIVAVLFLDLDRFQQINDALGHTAGDQLLRKVGERLQGMLGSQDIASRIASDEFVIVLTGLPNFIEALRKPVEFLDAMRRPFLVDGQEVFATASIGASVFPKDAETAAALLKKAERAMQVAKKHGKNDWRPCDHGRSGAPTQNLEMENALRHAIEKNELRMTYQPILTVKEELAGLEALLVWNHPKLGRISPAIFIPLAEDAGLIQQIGTWVLNEVCRQTAHWQAMGFAPVRVAANISALQFSRPEFFDAVRGALDQSRLPPEWLELELTESVIVQDFEESVRSIRRLRELGVRIAIDDFGTGYSSLQYLNKLPLDTLKIDRSFLSGPSLPGGSLPVVQTIVSLAHNLGLQVIAEGVETPEQMEMVRRAGCDKVQGHLYGTPVPGKEIEAILAQPVRMLRPLRK